MKSCRRSDLEPIHFSFLKTSYRSWISNGLTIFLKKKAKQFLGGNAVVLRTLHEKIP